MSNIISSYDEVINSSDVIERIKDLEEELEIFGDDDGDWEGAEELEMLRALDKEGDNIDEWCYNVALIRDSYFPEYAEELVKEIGYDIDGLPDFIRNNIDWDGVADDLKRDYDSVEFDGYIYWFRAA